MKYIVLLFLVGFASSASLYDGVDKAADELVGDFLVELKNAATLHDALDFDAVYAAETDDDDEVKTELGKTLKEALDHILEKIKDTIEKGKTVKEETLDKLKEIREKLKDLKIDIGEKAKELLEKLKEKAKDFLKNLLDKLGIGGDKEERSLNEKDLILRAFDIREQLKKIRDAILEKFDKERIKELVEKLFNKHSEIHDWLLDLLKEKGEKVKQKILDFIDKVLGDNENEVKRRSLQDLWKKVKDYFEKIQLHISEKWIKFGQWVKDTLKEKLEKIKDKKEQLKQIAKEVIDRAKDIGKDIAVEAQEYLRPYKEDMGALWDQLKEAVKEIVNRND